MRLCVICDKWKAFGDYYFCSNCYTTYKTDIMDNKPWVAEMKKTFWRDQKRAKRIRQMEAFLNDLHLVVGDDMEVYPNGEFDYEYD